MANIEKNIINGLTDLRDWVDDRFPLMQNWNEHLAKYYAPKNFNIWYYFGAFAILVFAIQILTGIWLTMNYKPSAEDAFASVEYIMRDVSWGWLIRYMHSTGASAFFIVIYLHMFRALLYGSYKKPRELLWLSGMGLYLVLMGEAFFGYLLPHIRLVELFFHLNQELNFYRKQYLPIDAFHFSLKKEYDLGLQKFYQL